MKETTRQQYKKLIAAVASSYGVDVSDVAGTFAISIPKETILNDAIVAQSDFLERITVLPVTDNVGQSVHMSIGSVAKRTNTSSKDRAGKELGDMNDLQYTCKLTEFDVCLPYTVLDNWARYPDFQQRWSTAVTKQIALDRIKIGFIGESAAADTTGSDYSLKDVNIGWLAQLKTHNEAQYLTEGAIAGKISIGAAGDYKNLDALVYDVYNMIDDAHRTGMEIAIVGRELVADDMGKAFVKQGSTPSEKQMVMVLDKTYGGLPTIVVPGFPSRGVMVTDPKNLHIYFQEGRMRRKLMDNPKRNRVEDFISSNEAYTFGDILGVAAIEAANVELKEA